VEHTTCQAAHFDAVGEHFIAEPVGKLRVFAVTRLHTIEMHRFASKPRHELHRILKRQQGVKLEGVCLVVAS
ncbi:hypothetical protein, partial [Pseudomonas aeruginosa]|uniref:hypothetical protein n=1 Tax=Pseudomonas aeruginosa TaxID=287 RepID=UPI001879BED0